MSNSQPQSQPYSGGRGFVPLNRREEAQARNERRFGHGGLGLRYGEWGQLPNATGEIMRGVSANYDWRNYTPKNIRGQNTGLAGSRFGRPNLPFNGPPLMGPQQPGPVSQQAWGESSILASDADRGGMGEDTWPKESSIASAGAARGGMGSDVFRESTVTPAWAPKGGMGSDSSILPSGSSWAHDSGDAGQMSLPGISPDNGDTPTWESTRSKGGAISPQFQRQGQQGTLFDSAGGASADTFYRPPSNMGLSRP